MHVLWILLGLGLTQQVGAWWIDIGCFFRYCEDTSYAPVCASNQATYFNRCYFYWDKRCDEPGIYIVHDGLCSEDCENRVCTEEYDPVCGSDGVTYSNRCYFNLAQRCDNPDLTVANFSVCNTDTGLCPDGSRPFNCLVSPCEVSTCPAFPGADCVDNFCGGCNADYSVGGEPVVCDKQPPSVCLDCRLVRVACTDELRDSSCNCKPYEQCCDNCCGGQSCIPKEGCKNRICTEEYDPVCGSDGVTYSNRCYFNLAQRCDNPDLTEADFSVCNTVIEHNPCEGPGLCPLHYEPVCGSDGVIYSNSCFLKLAQCDNPDLTGVDFSVCTDDAEHNPCEGPGLCPLYHEPVCGSDGVIYSNSCFLNLAKCDNPDLTQADFSVCSSDAGGIAQQS